MFPSARPTIHSLLQSALTRFLLKFSFFFAVLSAFTQTELVRGSIAPRLAGWLAEVTAGICSSLGVTAVAAQYVVFSPATSHYLVVDFECTGIAASATMVAALFAFPGRRRVSIIAALCGIVAVQCFNVIRFVHLFDLLQRDRAAFDIFHLYVWQPLGMVLIAAFVIAAARLSARPEAPRAEGAAGTLTSAVSERKDGAA